MFNALKLFETHYWWVCLLVLFSKNFSPIYRSDVQIVLKFLRSLVQTFLLCYKISHNKHHWRVFDGFLVDLELQLNIIQRSSQFKLSTFNRFFYLDSVLWYWELLFTNLTKSISLNTLSFMHYEFSTRLKQRVIYST